MADSAPVSRTPLLAPERQTYARAKLVGQRAAVTESPDSERLSKAINRLDAFLAGGRPPRTDVPPGFYFNATV